MRQKILMIFLVAFIVSTGGIVSKAFADAILFPWIVKGDSVSTVISVISTAGTYSGQCSYNGVPFKLHYDYWYKSSTSGDTEPCEHFTRLRNTCMNDLVSFDAAGIIGGGEPLYNDNNDLYGWDLDFSLLGPSPRSGFLIVDNNTELMNYFGENIDGTLSGEALIIDHSTGMVWGYTAYNARFTGESDDPNGVVLFLDGLDYQGEVIGANETARTVLSPPSELATRFYVTPIGWGQRNGAINTKVYLGYQIEPGVFHPGIYDNQGHVTDMSQRVNVACTAALTLEELMTPATYTNFTASGRQGWAYIKTEEGSLVGNNIVKSSQAVIGKLEWQTVTQTISADLSDSEGCALCTDGCLSRCANQGHGMKPDVRCQFQCKRICRNVCSPKIEFDTQHSNFNWIRSGESLPAPPLGS